MVTAAPACKAMLAEATRLWPNRSTLSDGILPSAAHTIQNPTSDHERGLAVDVTHDPASGCDVAIWAEQLRLRRDARVKYVIHNRRIWNPAISPDWRRYTGTNPHLSHMHVSIWSGSRLVTDPWWVPPAAPAPAPLPPLGGIDDEWWFDVALFKDDTDKERAFIRSLYLAHLRREPESLEAQDWWRLVLHADGADLVIARIADSDEGQYVRAQMNKTFGIQP